MKTVLILDNDRGIRLLLSEELAQEGYDVVTCGDGSRPQDTIEQCGPDVIIMDVRVGPHDGLDLLQDIRHRHEELPIILYTACPAFINDLKSMAADYFVIKSLDLRELKSTVNMALKGIPQLHAYRERNALDRTPMPSIGQLGLVFGEKA